MRPDKLSIPFLTVKECDEIVQSSDKFIPICFEES